MKDFFTFYENIQELRYPFLAFSNVHLWFLVIIGVAIWLIYRYYKTLQPHQKKRFQRGLALYFLIEEVIYTGWLLLHCHNQLWIQILPLELCSICVYINACSVFFKKEYFRFFSAVVGLVAGAVAMLYPANISAIYPIVSYRVINFYILHGAFVLFAFMQLQDRSLLSYKHIKKNTIMICCMFTIAFFVNLFLNSQYMFVGIPPKIEFIAYVFRFCGIVFFLPMVLIVVTLLQFVVLFFLRICYRVKKNECSR